MAMRQSRAKVAIETRVEKCEGLGRYTAQSPFDQDAGCQARKNRYSNHGYSHGFADQRWTTLFQTVLFSPDSYLACEQCVLQSALADPKKYSCRWVIQLVLISKKQKYESLGPAAFIRRETRYMSDCAPVAQPDRATDF
jgi:hypothetical protein